MDNATYDELNLTPVNNDETYSRLRRTHNKIRPSDEGQRKGNFNQNTTEKKHQAIQKSPLQC